MKAWNELPVQLPKWILFSIGACILFLAVFLFARLAPWWQAGVTPVEVDLRAPAGATVFLHWQEGESPMRLVPVDDPDEHAIHALWMTELPPRPQYQLALEWTAEEGTVEWMGIRVYTLSPRKEAIAYTAAGQFAGWDEFAQEAVFTGVAPWPVAFASEEVLSLGSVDRRPEALISTFARPFLNLSLLVLLGGGLIACGLFFPAQLSAFPFCWGRIRSLAVITVFVISAGLHWHLVKTSVPEFWPADSTSYADKGLALGYGATFDTGGHEYELNRLPGYPLLVAAAFRLIEPSLNAVITLQTMLCLAAFGFLFWRASRFLHPWLLLAGIPFVLLSPALIWASRQIATESLFVSLWVIAVGCALWTLERPEGRRLTPWSLFILAVISATMVRANGILLLTIPGCFMIGMLVRVWRLESGCCRLTWPSFRQWSFVLIPFVATVLVVVAWSARNAHHRGYFGPTDLAPVVASNAPFNAGMLDLRVFEDNPDLYAWIIQQRRNQGYFFHGWHLRNRQFMDIWRTSPQLDHSTIGQLADAQKQFVADNHARIPWEARLVAWWRVLDWGLWFPQWGNFTQDGLQTNYEVPHAFRSDWLRETVGQRMEWLARDRGEGVRYPLVTFSEGRESVVTNHYNRWIVPAYPYFYRILLTVGLFALLFSLLQRAFAPVVLLMPYFVNILLNVYFLYVVGRYVQVLDGMILLGVLGAFSAICYHRSSASRNPSKAPPC